MCTVWQVGNMLGIYLWNCHHGQDNKHFSSTSLSSNFILLVYNLLLTLVAQLAKNLPAVWETWVRSLGWEDPLEKGTTTHGLQNSPVFWPGEFHGLYSPWSRTWLSDFYFISFQPSFASLSQPSGGNLSYLLSVTMDAFTFSQILCIVYTLFLSDLFHSAR